MLCGTQGAAFVGTMFTARKKIQKEKNAEPSEFEESVAQARPLRWIAACLLRLLRCSAPSLQEL